MLITQRLRRAAQLRGAKVAVTCEGHSRTWNEVRERVARLAGGFRELGLLPGERIAILSDNTLPFYELYFAAPWAGLVMASLNTRWSLAECADALNGCEAAALVVDEAYLPLAQELRECVPSLRIVIARGFDAQWDELATSARGASDRSTAPNDVAYLFFTGGTTGRAKGVMLTSLNLYAAGLSMIHTSGVSDTSVLAINVPLFHMSGGGLWNTQLTAAATVCLLRKFEPDSSMATVEAERVTHVVWVPTMLSMILNSPSFGRYDLSSLERIIYGSAPMPEALLRRALQELPRTRFTQYYGMTETSGTGVSLQPEDHDVRAPNPRLRAAGVVVPGVELRVVRPSGTEAAPGEGGEICLRGPIITKGYWGEAEKTAEAIRDGWMHTGDAGYVDDEGYVFVVDRLKDMIITGGENVYSIEVENAVYTHPAVKECGVIGLADAKWGEIVCAVVHLAEGAWLDEESLREHCRGLIGGYKLPRKVIFSENPLPKSAAGKILKAELRGLYGG